MEHDQKGKVRELIENIKAPSPTPESALIREGDEDSIKHNSSKEEDTIQKGKRLR
jgi:hypothetical protein